MEKHGLTSGLRSITVLLTLDGDISAWPGVPGLVALLQLVRVISLVPIEREPAEDDWRCQSAGSAGIQLTGSGTSTLKGRDATTVVPCIGRERMSILPPNSRKRSSMLRMPMPASVEAAFGSKPLP